MFYTYRIQISLIVSIIFVQLMYIIFIDPRVDEILLTAAKTGETLPRNIFILLKDFEQKTCLMIFLWGAYVCYDKFLQLNKSSFIYKVDLLKDFDQDDMSAESIVEKLERLSADIKDTPVVKVLIFAFRRFLITKSVDSAADSISSSLDIISIRNANDLAVVKYIAWAIPSIGFLGTVRGIGAAMSKADLAVAGDIGPMTESLGVAFNSTFVSLIISILLMLLLSYLQRAQDDDLLSIQDYCELNLLNRLSKKKL